MTTHRKKIKAKVTNFVEQRQNAKKYLTSVGVFVVVAASIAFGYGAGAYRLQIEAAIGPVFGQKVHDTEIDLSSVQEVYSRLVSNYDGTINKKDLIEGAKTGLVNAVGDTYTTYLGAQDSAEFNDSLNGNIGGGIGAVIGVKNNQITIMSVLKNNPAIEAGLQANDTILKVNDELTEGWAVDKAVSKIRGEEGTTVKLTILRGSDIKDFTITRAIINNPSVSSEVKDGIGIITMTRFDDETAKLARQAAQDFKKQSVKGVVLDLRDNSGGYLQAAKDVAGLWLDNEVVVTEKVGGKVKETLKSGSNAILAGIPTVVLVNNGSASASEIVAGALQDHDAATIVGNKTYGKGSVQQLIDLSGGAQLKVTIARWYTPNGKNITKEGITPDEIVNLSQEDVDKGSDPQLDKAKVIIGL